MSNYGVSYKTYIPNKCLHIVFFKYYPKTVIQTTESIDNNNHADRCHTYNKKTKPWKGDP